MSNAIILTVYKLKEGVPVPDFLRAADKFHEVFVLKQKGVISCKLLANAEMWADYSVWESMDDFKSADPQSPDEFVAMNEYFSYIDGGSAIEHHLNVEKSY